MTFHELAARIDTLEEKYISLWKEITAIESPTESKEGVDAVGAFLIGKAKEFGWTVQQNEEKISGNALCLTMNADVDAPAICYSGHMDTVFPVGTLREAPVRTEGEYIYGPGISDCKGGIAAAFCLMEALQSLGYRERPLKLILQADEENSSMNSAKRNTRFMAEMAKGCRAFLNTEPHGSTAATHPEGRINTVITRKGIQRFRFTVTGRADHSATCYNGASALTEAAYKIIELEKMKDRTGTTCNCSMMQSGSTPNSVPDKAVFTADFRYNDPEALRLLEAEAQRIADTSFVEGTACRLEVLSRRISMVQTEANKKLFDDANEIFAACGLPLLGTARSGGGSDAGDMTAAGIPTLDSFGVYCKFAHNPREYSSLASMKEAALRLGALTLGLK